MTSIFDTKIDTFKFEFTNTQSQIKPRNKSVFITEAFPFAQNNLLFNLSFGNKYSITERSTVFKKLTSKSLFDVVLDIEMKEQNPDALEITPEIISKIDRFTLTQSKYGVSFYWARPNPDFNDDLPVDENNQRTIVHLLSVYSYDDEHPALVREAFKDIANAIFEYIRAFASHMAQNLSKFKSINYNIIYDLAVTGFILYKLAGVQDKTPLMIIHTIAAKKDINLETWLALVSSNMSLDSALCDEYWKGQAGNFEIRNVTRNGVSQEVVKLKFFGLLGKSFTYNVNMFSTRRGEPVGDLTLQKEFALV